MIGFAEFRLQVLAHISLSKISFVISVTTKWAGNEAAGMGWLRFVGSLKL